MIQHIICTTSEVVDREIKKEGFTNTNKKIFSPESIWVGPRDTLESNENYRQIIPYVLLSYKNKIAVYKRTKKGAENRLHNMLSIGFGGHIDAFDLAYDTVGEIDINRTIGISAQREIDEELKISGIHSKKKIGYIVDNSNPVGRVHIGAVEIWELSGPAVYSNEEEIEVLGLFSLDDLKRIDGDIENWTSLIINGL